MAIISDKQLLEVTKTQISLIGRALKWRVDVENSEMIQQKPDYLREALTLKYATQEDVTLMVEVVNSVLIQLGSNLRVRNEENRVLPSYFRG